MRPPVLRALCALSLAAASACDDDPAATEPPAPASPRLHVGDGQLRDGLGRAVLLRGVNARVEGLFDVTFDDGRQAVEPIPALDETDCQRMAELGFDLLRLPLSWSGIEPQRDAIDQDYLASVDRVVRCARESGLYVLLDLHQDAYSKEIGEDGAPLWAIQPPPEELLEGPLTPAELLSRRFSRQVTAAFETFFASGDPSGLQAELIDVAVLLARRYADEPWVVGLDVFNEPVTEPALAREFNERAAAAVRQAAPELLVFFEPTGNRALTGGEPVPPGGAFAVEGSVYAPHIYPLVFVASADTLAAATEQDIAPDMEAAISEARAWGTPWLIGEWGAGPMHTGYLAAHLNLQDRHFVGAAQWLWKEESQDSWGLFDRTADGWRERPEVVALASRPRARRVAGRTAQVTLGEGELRVDIQDALDAPHELFIPEGIELRAAECDGAPLPLPAANGRVVLACGSEGDHSLRVTW